MSAHQEAQKRAGKRRTLSLAAVAAAQPAGRPAQPAAALIWPASSRARAVADAAPA